MLTISSEPYVGRAAFLPYCLPCIGQEEIDEVVDSLKSGWVTTGPKVKRFENLFAAYVGAKHAIAVNSCTAALQTALAALGIGPGDEVIVPTLTFCATANVVVHLGATPVIVDVTAAMQICPDAVRRAITRRTKAIIPIHYGGQACDLDKILEIANAHALPVVEDAAHAIGSEYQGKKIGTHSTAVAFSFYATKNLTTGEGGMIATDDDDLAARMRVLSLHGMSRDAWNRYSETGSWYYEVVEPGYKNNMTDLQASLGIHQLAKLDGFIRRRQQIASAYQRAFAGLRAMILPQELRGRNHVYHLYAIQLRKGTLSIDRAQFIRLLHEARIGAGVHFIPLHRHPAFAQFGYGPAQFPIAESIYEGLLSLPLYPGMTDDDVDDVIRTTTHIVETNSL